MKHKRKLCVGLYVAGVLISFIFVMYLTMKHATTPPAEPTIPSMPTTAPSEPTSVPEIKLIEEPVLFSDLVCSNFESVESAELFIDRVAEAIDTLMIECSTQDKYTAEAITAMLEEIDRLTAEQTNAIREKNCLVKWEEKLEEYPYATKMWQFLKDSGYSDAACAGIIGNAMAECGGNTLSLQPLIYSANGKYYGIFQWSLKYNPDVGGESFEAQLDYFSKTVERVFEIWGDDHYKGFTYEDFRELDSPEEAALAFAKIYERCSKWTYERRQRFSAIAYQYFVLDFEET